MFGSQSAREARMGARRHIQLKRRPRKLAALLLRAVFAIGIFSLHTPTPSAGIGRRIVLTELADKGQRCVALTRR